MVSYRYGSTTRPVDRSETVSAEFGQLIRAAMQDKGLSQGRVAVLVGLYDGDRYLDATQVRLLMNGTRKPTRGLVERLVEVLDLDPAEAWATAGITPPGFRADHFRKLAFFGAHGEQGTGWYRASPGHSVTLPVPDELDTLIRRTRRDRRQRNRRQRNRRRLRLVPQLEKLEEAA
jgi:transcriptional regulator with XRE-family HTH domain